MVVRLVSLIISKIFVILNIVHQKNYKIEIPVTSWNNKNLIRISIQAYNTKEDIHKLSDALHEIRSN